MKKLGIALLITGYILFMGLLVFAGFYASIGAGVFFLSLALGFSGFGILLYLAEKDIIDM